MSLEITNPFASGTFNSKLFRIPVILTLKNGRILAVADVRYGNGTDDSYMVTNKRYDVVITPTGSSGLENDSTWTAKTFNCTTNCLIGTTSVEATSAKLTGTVYGDFIIEGKCQYAPVERISDGAIGYVDLLTGHFSENLGTGTPQALGYA